MVLEGRTPVLDGDDTAGKTGGGASPLGDASGSTFGHELLLDRSNPAMVVTRFSPA
jgi:hypothetical protein